jgi:hypothetical protein
MPLANALCVWENLALKCGEPSGRLSVLMLDARLPGVCALRRLCPQANFASARGELVASKRGMKLLEDENVTNVRRSAGMVPAWR